MLSLPDAHAYYDACLVWRCQEPGCPHACHATGIVHQQSRNLTVANWEAALARERQRGTIESQVAAREERWKVR